MIDGLLTKKDVAGILQISERQVRRLIAERRLPAIRFGHKTVRVKPADLERYLRGKTY